MGDNGERIYAGLMEREEMRKLEEENQPPMENDFLWENDKYKLPNLLAALGGEQAMNRASVGL